MKKIKFKSTKIFNFSVEYMYALLSNFDYWLKEAKIFDNYKKIIDRNNKILFEQYFGFKKEDSHPMVENLLNNFEKILENENYRLILEKYITINEEKRHAFDKEGKKDLIDDIMDEHIFEKKYVDEKIVSSISFEFFKKIPPHDAFFPNAILEIRKVEEVGRIFSFPDMQRIKQEIYYIINFQPDKKENTKLIIEEQSFEIINFRNKKITRKSLPKRNTITWLLDTIQEGISKSMHLLLKKSKKEIITEINENKIYSKRVISG